MFIIYNIFIVLNLLIIEWVELTSTYPTVFGPQHRHLSALYYSANLAGCLILCLLVNGRSLELCQSCRYRCLQLCSVAAVRRYRDFEGLARLVSLKPSFSAEWLCPRCGGSECEELWRQ